MQKRRLNPSIGIAVLAVCGLLFSPAHAATIAGRVISIADGDTLTLLDAQNREHPISLAGIDAPELAQAFGQQAKSSLAALALDRQATANCNQPGSPREICIVSVGGKDIGLEQIRLGMAWWYGQNAAGLTVQTQTGYRQAEFNAKIHRLGLWNSTNPTPPWVWRHGRLDE